MKNVQVNDYIIYDTPQAEPDLELMKQYKVTQIPYIQYMIEIDTPTGKRLVNKNDFSTLK
jgi:hypothetical protein